MLFKRSESIKIFLLPEQEKQISPKERIKSACAEPGIFAFDIFHNEYLVGFIMVREYEKGEYFLWNYAVDHKFQNKGIGTRALLEFIEFMKTSYNMKVLTTTYIWGNEHAKHVYEKIGFTQTDVVDEPDCHEVNMVYKCE